MLGKPRILSIFLNSSNKFNKHEHSCKILYLCNVMVIAYDKCNFDPTLLLEPIWKACVFHVRLTVNNVQRVKHFTTELLCSLGHKLIIS